MTSIGRKWPKVLPKLSLEQEEIREDFMRYWHEILPNKFQFLEKFNHNYPVKRRKKTSLKTLEVGAGLGEQMRFENLEDQEYHVLELRPSWATTLKNEFPKCHVLIADCQNGIPYPDEYFDRVLAIHVLEHLPNLPEALKEIRRVLKRDGQFCIVIPCEGGRLYGFCRAISAQRIFEKRYKQKYDWLIASEHVNRVEEILEEVRKIYHVKHSSFFPLLVPNKDINLCVGLTLEPPIFQV